MKIAYLDCSAGIAGDMMVASLLDAGMSFDYLKKELGKLPLKDYQLSVKEVEKHFFRATHFHVECKDNQPHRHYTDIRRMIEAVDWPSPVKQTAQAIFKKLGEAEARVHGCNLEDVHFHEVGAVDSIIDICGTAIGLHQLGIEALYASPVNVGSGEVKTAHGVMPIPAPATMLLAKDIPIYSRHAEKELATPTGMAILAALAKGFGPVPAMTPQAHGSGAGTMNLPIPNLLRLTVGEAAAPSLSKDWLTDEIIEIEADIDDMNPEWYGHVMEKLTKAGASDVSLAPIYMKKQRPATRMTVLTPQDRLQAMAHIILEETTTLGLRYRAMQRIKARREHITRQTVYGPMRFKRAILGQRVLSCKPEYEDCKRIADERGLPLKEIYATITQQEEEMA